jgi:hypothetical protein
VTFLFSVHSCTDDKSGRSDTEVVMKSNEELVNALRSAPAAWLDTAIVVAFENRVELVAEDHPDPICRLNSLQEQSGLAIGLAGIKSSGNDRRTFQVQLFEEFEGQAWAHRCMDQLRGIVRKHSLSK